MTVILNLVFFLSFDSCRLWTSA